METIFALRWQANTPATFDYGSQITRDVGGNVTFVNPMLSPGDIIYSWSEPAGLPILTPGGTYGYNCLAQVKPAGSMGISFAFFDHEGGLIDTVEDRQLFGQLTVPDTCDHYQISLVNLSMHTLQFAALWLGPIETMATLSFTADTREPLLTAWQAEPQHDEMQVVLMPARQDGYTCPIGTAAVTRYMGIHADALIDPEYRAALRASLSSATGLALNITTLGLDAVVVTRLAHDLEQPVNSLREVIR